MNRLSSVGSVRRDMITVMQDLSSVLGTARQHLLAMTAQTDALIGLQDQPRFAVAHIPDLASDLAQALHDWSASIDSGASRQHLRATRVQLNSLTRIRMFFQFLATITSIQISRDRSGQLTAFVGELRAVSRQIETELAELQTSLDLFDRSFDEIIAVARSGAEHLEPAARELSAILAPIIASERQMTERSGRITAQARDLSRRVEGVIGGMVGTFQFSDSAAQRLEHAETILERADMDPAFGVLAATQLRAMAEDATLVRGDLEDSLDTIGGLGGSFVAELSAQRGEVERLLSAQEAAFDRLKTVLGKVMPTLQAIITRSAGFDGEIDLLRERLQKLSRIGQTIGLAGVNSHLEAARAEVGQKELTYIAMSVKETAQLALQTFTDTGKSLDALRTSFDTSAYAQLQERMSQLETHLGTLGTGLEQAQGRQLELTQLVDGTRVETAALSELAKAGRQKTAGLARTIAEIEALSRALDADCPATPDLRGLAQIEPIYTMDREREVHAGLVGTPWNGATQAAAAVIEVQDSLDSILF